MSPVNIGENLMLKSYVHLQDVLSKLKKILGFYWVARNTFLILLLLASILITAASYRLYMTKLHIRKMDLIFSQVRAGDNANLVEANFRGLSEAVFFHKNEISNPVYLNAGFVNDQVRELRYTQETFFLPITWSFLVDEKKLIVAKHRYD